MYKLSVNKNSAIKILILSIIFLASLSLIGQIFDHVLGYTKIPVIGFIQISFVKEFDVGGEFNIPTYFSGFILLLASVIIYVIACIERERKSSFYRHWFGLSIVFAYISVDEIATLHERIIEPLRQLLGAEGIFYYTWVIPAAVGLLLLGILYGRFLWHLPARWKGLFAVAAALYIGGALGIELIGGWYASNYETESFVYALLETVEETLEMTGTALFIYALLDYLSSRVEGVAIMFQPAPDG